MLERTYRHATVVAILSGLLIAAVAHGDTRDRPSAATQRPPLRVGLVADPAFVNSPIGRNLISGLRRAMRELGVTAVVLTPGPKDGPNPSLAYLARQHYDLIIPVNFTPEGLDAAARRFPGARFLAIDLPPEELAHRPRNVRSVLFRSEEAAYLAGYLAGLVEKRRPGRDTISSVGGKRIVPVDRFIIGYQAGARRAAPGIRTLNAYSGDFIDTGKCKAIAADQIARGSRVVFNVAGACGLGALSAARSAGVYGLGVDVDQSFLGPHILTSAVKRYDVVLFNTIRDVQRGTFTSRAAVYSLRDGGVGLGRISPQVPRSIVRKVRAVRRQILEGRIEVPSAIR